MYDRIALSDYSVVLVSSSLRIEDSSYLLSSKMSAFISSKVVVVDSNYASLSSPGGTRQTRKRNEGVKQQERRPRNLKKTNEMNRISHSKIACRERACNSQEE